MCAYKPIALTSDEISFAQIQLVGRSKQIPVGERILLLFYKSIVRDLCSFISVPVEPSKIHRTAPLSIMDTLRLVKLRHVTLYTTAAYHKRILRMIVEA